MAKLVHPVRWADLQRKKGIMSDHRTQDLSPRNGSFLRWRLRRSVRRVCALAPLALVAGVPLLTLRAAEACGCAAIEQRFSTPAPDIDRRIWTTFTGSAGFIPRTAFRNPSSTPDARGRLPVTRGGVVMTLSRFNPTARIPGDSFWGSHIATRKSYLPPSPNFGIEFTVRLHVPKHLPPGIVIGVFLWGPTRDAASDFKSEIDLELVSNNLQRGKQPQVLLNLYVDERPGVGRPVEVPAPGMDLSRSTTLTIRWFPHQQQTEWLVNGRLIHRTAEHVPTSPMAAHINIWAPDETFAAAYSPALQPARAAAKDASYAVLVEAVTVAYVPVPAAGWQPPQ